MMLRESNSLFSFFFSSRIFALLKKKRVKKGKGGKGKINFGGQNLLSNDIWSFSVKRAT